MTQLKPRLFTVNSFALIMLVVFCNSLAQLFLKAAALVALNESGSWLTFLNIWYIYALACFALSFLLWQKVLQCVPLTYAHPFGSLVYLIVPIVSWGIYGETILLKHCIGIAFICIGVCFTVSGASKGAQNQVMIQP